MMLLTSLKGSVTPSTWTAAVDLIWAMNSAVTTALMLSPMPRPIMMEWVPAHPEVIWVVPRVQQYAEQENHDVEVCSPHQVVPAVPLQVVHAVDQAMPGGCADEGVLSELEEIVIPEGYAIDEDGEYGCHPDLYD